MKRTHYYTALAAGFFAVATVFGQSTERLQAVSIVFTDATNNATIDTIVPAGEPALHDLLASKGLSPQSAHIMFLDRAPFTPKDGDRKEIIMIQSEEVEEGKAPRRVEFIEVDGVRKTRDELSPEELKWIRDGGPEGKEVEVRIEEEMENGHSTRNIWIDGEKVTEEEFNAFEEAHANDGRKKEVIRIEEGTPNEKGLPRKRERNAEGIRNNDAREMDVRIEENVVNGHIEKQIWINGKEATEAELAAFEKKHERLMGDALEKEIIEVREEGPGGEREVIIREGLHATGMDGVKDAIVIVRSIQAPEKAVSALGLSTQFNVYPNPANDKVHLRFDTPIEGRYSVQITSLDGKVVRQLNGNGKRKSNLELDLADISAGTYIVTVGLEEGLLSSKLIIE